MTIWAEKALPEDRAEIDAEILSTMAWLERLCQLAGYRANLVIDPDGEPE